MSEKFEFIDGLKCAYPIVKMCAWLEVPKSGFYDWPEFHTGPPLAHTAPALIEKGHLTVTD